MDSASSAFLVAYYRIHSVYLSREQYKQADITWKMPIYLSGPSRQKCPAAITSSGYIWWTLRSRCQKQAQLLKRTRCFATMLSQRAILSCSWYFIFLVFILKVHLVESVWKIHIACQPKGNLGNVVFPLRLVLHSCESNLGSWNGCWLNHLSVSSTNGTGLKVIMVV